MREAAQNPNALAKGGWSQSGLLQTFVSTDKVKCQANMPRSIYYTVQFAITAPSPVEFSNGAGGLIPYPFVYRAVATVRWNVEGNNVQRQLDVGQGTVISGPAQGFSVSVQDATDSTTSFPLFGFADVTTGSPDVSFFLAQNFSVGQEIVVQGDASGTVYTVETVVDDKHIVLSQPYLGVTSATAAVFLSLKYTVSVQVSEGTRPTNGTLPPVLFGLSTTLNPGVGPGSTIEVLVPVGSGANSVEVVALSDNAASKPNVAVAQLTGGLVIKSYDPTINTGFVSLMPNALAIQVANQDTSDEVNICLTWGIDG
jgi:hypothetical protein